MNDAEHEPQNKAQNSGLKEFFRFVADFQNVFALIGKLAVAVPLMDLVTNVGPPWPSRLAVALVGSAYVLLVLMCSFVFWRQGEMTVTGVRKWLLLSTVGFGAVFIVGYVPLFASFICNAPDRWHRVIVGYELQPNLVPMVSKEPSKWTCKALLAKFVDDTHDEASVWTQLSLTVTRTAILAAWVFCLTLYAMAVSSFVALQYRKPSKRVVERPI